jgi:hypothetical protein
MEKWREHGIDLKELKKINAAAAELLQSDYLSIQ